MSFLWIYGKGMEKRRITVKYVVLEHTNLTILQLEVREYIEERGYIPQGGIAVTVSTYGRTVYYQAMIKGE